MNRLFGMFHAQTTDHIKAHIISSMSQACGTVRVVFATVALGMGVNFVNLNHKLLYTMEHQVVLTITFKKVAAQDVQVIMLHLLSTGSQ